jgi:hypothetical protein
MSNDLTERGSSPRPPRVRKRNNRYAFDLEKVAADQEIMDTVYNRSFKQILRMREPEREFLEDDRLFFQERLEFAKEMMERDHQHSDARLKEYLLWKAKIAVIDLMLSDDIQRTIRVASEKGQSPAEADAPLDPAD